ncbi:MAG: aconitase family protein, partial [Pseudomonadota bacterium]
LALAIIAKIGTAGGTGAVIEFMGSAIRELSMEGRMTLCNMAIEAGARAGLIGVDEKTIGYLENRPSSPKGENWSKAVEYWQEAVSDEGSKFDMTFTLDGNKIKPMVTWGTSPEQAIAIDEVIPSRNTISQIGLETFDRALDYMDLQAGQKIAGVAIQRVFIGSCTNSRIEDLREAASVARGQKVAPSVRAMVVPGSGLVKLQAEAEGLADIFI